MKTTLYRLSLPALLLAATPALVFAHPMRTRTTGSESQTVTMCPSCSQPMDCARVGDYRLEFSADVDNPTNGGKVRFTLVLTDRLGQPATNTKVALIVSTMEGGQQPRVLPMKGGRGGRYTAQTTVRPIDMQAPWRADVKVTTPKGDIVTQAFTVSPWRLVAVRSAARRG